MLKKKPRLPRGILPNKGPLKELALVAPPNLLLLRGYHGSSHNLPLAVTTVSHTKYYLKFSLTVGKQGPTPWRFGRGKKKLDSPVRFTAPLARGSHKAYEIISDPAAAQRESDLWCSNEQFIQLPAGNKRDLSKQGDHCSYKLWIFKPDAPSSRYLRVSVPAASEAVRNRVLS